MRRQLTSGKASFDRISNRILDVDYLLEKENNVGATDSINVSDATEHVEHWDIKRVALIIRVARTTAS